MRVLSFEVTTRGVSYVLTEGARRVVDWGIRRSTRDLDLERLILEARPDCLVLEDPMRSKKGARATRGISKAARVARDLEVPVVAVEWMPRKRFALTDELVATYPELRRVRPKNRASWHADPPNLDVFVALGRALHVTEIFERTNCRPGKFGPVPND